MKKNRMTRLSFKRKAVTFGAIVFASVALGTTGFAAWVMSRNADEEVTGNVNVGLVEGGALSFSDVVIASEAKGFYFEPKQEDTTGRVKYKAGLGESMEITVTGKISPLQELDKLYYRVQIPQGVQDAAEAGYIVLPSGATTDAKATAGDADFVEGVAIAYDGTTGTYEFSFDVAFAWGEVFGEANPGIYYDSEDGKDIPHEEARKTLEDFRAVLYGYAEDLQAIENNEEYSVEKKAEERAKVIAAHENDGMPDFIIYVYAESKY